jgi:hypothetical protein
MGLQHRWRRCVARLLAGAGLLAGVAPAAAQNGSSNPYCPPPPACLPPGYAWPGTTAPGGQMPGTAAPNSTSTNPAAPNPAAPDLAAAPTVAPESSGLALSGSSVAMAAPGAYLDNAIPRTMFRLRYDAGFDMNRPDRAEFFYATWKELSFHPHGINGDGTFFDPKARGPEQLPGKLDFQDVTSYFEYAFNKRLSVFADVPVRFLNFRDIQEDFPSEEMKPPGTQNLAPNPGSPFFPEPNRGMSESHQDRTGGLSDVTAGFKFAVVADPDRYVTFQFQTFIPTGDPHTGLGTGHASLEPGLLVYQRLTDRLAVQGQFEDWIPIGGGPGAGNVLIYGLGVGYDVYQRCNLRITPVAEFVGWTVLNGFESVDEPIVATPPPGFVLPRTHGVEDAGGDTIINAKLGVRTYFGRGNDVYVGWGHALTNDRWYRDIVRVEYRYSF